MQNQGPDSVNTILPPPFMPEITPVNPDNLIALADTNMGEETDLTAELASLRDFTPAQLREKVGQYRGRLRVLDRDVTFKRETLAEPGVPDQATLAGASECAVATRDLGKEMKALDDAIDDDDPEMAEIRSELNEAQQVYAEIVGNLEGLAADLHQAGFTEIADEIGSILAEIDAIQSGFSTSAITNESDDVSTLGSTGSTDWIGLIESAADNPALLALIMKFLENDAAMREIIVNNIQERKEEEKELEKLMENKKEERKPIRNALIEQIQQLDTYRKKLSVALDTLQVANQKLEAMSDQLSPQQYAALLQEIASARSKSVQALTQVGGQRNIAILQAREEGIDLSNV
ncbi:MAG: hypothetical protein KKB81_01790 [Candidatus Margulisbacteria bacterium]|nr:hypothetical protein [Candidatus Margulisiibacteriota bacterium]MBU1021648.1 hypothetical protein [Candidatus Margulisiibacteriota bacterium]MBU1728798.1 hypothetical protein [Candidatus Margulisiibacteriota bacterium]MBU1955764.1 hypothetical protein [Candidatus Margulisiibacteriota bacterium]